MRNFRLMRGFGRQEVFMLDAIYVISTLIFFALTAAYAVGCSQL